MKVFRVAVTGYETYIPLDFSHPNKNEQEFEKDVRNVIQLVVDSFIKNSLSVEMYIEDKDLLGAFRHEYPKDYATITDELIKLGYEEVNNYEISLGGECLYSDKNEKPLIIDTESWKKIVDHNNKISKKCNEEVVKGEDVV